jgi:choline monooxygenase
LMINRYGPWLDTNLVLPTSPESCTVKFDYFLEPGLAQDQHFIDRSLQDSEQVGPTPS